MSSPKCMWKSQHLEFAASPSTSLMKRKSESLEKYNTPPRPLRRSDSGRESLYSSSSGSKQCAELNLSESKMNKEKKRKKHKNLTQVTMESEKAEVNLESVVVKRKKMTGRSFKSLFKSKHKKETVPVIITEELALSQSEKLLNYQRTEEQVQLVYSKMQYLKRIHSPCSLNTIDSGRDHLLAEEDINQKTSIVDEGKSPFSSFKLKNVKMTIEEDSAIEENYEGHILLQQKLALKNKGAQSEIGILINKIQKKCDKRMKKLIQNQKGQIQEFHQIWEEKRLKLEKDHKLESAIIRSIFSEGSARMDKLKLLDDKFAKKVEENNLLKDVQLKDLEAEQSAARNEERQKAAHWLAEAKACCSSEVRDGCGPRSFGSQSEEVAGCSQSSTHILGTKDVVPFSRQHGENKDPSRSVQGNDIAPSDASVCATSEEVGCIAPIGNPDNFISTDPQNEVGITISERSMLAVVERLNQPKHFGTGESICLNLPASGERLHGEMLSVELNKDIPPEVPETVPNEIVDYANPVELSNNTSNKGFGEGDAIGLPDALVNQRDGTDETTIGGLALAGQILEPSEQTKASPHRCALLLPQVPADQIHQGLVSAEIQDQGAQAVEKQNTFPFEVAASEQVDTVTILQSNIELQDRDEPAIETLSTSQIEVATSEIFNTATPEESSIKLQDRDAPVVNDQVTLQSEVANSELVASPVTPVQSDIDAPAIENCEQLHLESIDVSPSCNQFSSIELESQNQRDGTDDTTIGGLALAGQILEPSDQTKASPHHCALLLPQVPEDQIHRGLVSAEIQDQGSHAVEKQNTFPFEVAASEEVDTVTILQSHIELQDLDEPAIETQSTSRIEVATSEIFNTVSPEKSSIKPQDRGAPVVKDQVTLQSEVANSELVATVTPVQSNIDAPAIENCEQLHIESIDVSPSCSQFSSIELESQIHNLGRNSSRTAEAEVPSHEPASQLGENLELQSNHLDMGSESQFAHETSFEMSASSQNNVAMAQAGASTIELPHQAVLQLGVCVGHLSGSSYLFSHPSHEVASLNSPSLLAEPLQNELEKIRKETEQLQKSREDMISRLKSDCEKEIQEIITEVHNKYELKIQDAEAKYSLKKNRLVKNQNKVLMNKLLAEAFNSDCLDLWSSGLPEMQQAFPSRSMQHLHQLSLQHLVRPPPATTACQPALGPQIASPNLQAMQQLSLPHSTRLCPVTGQNFAARPVQATQHAMALSFGTPSRTPFISALSPTGNLCFGGEMRSSAPHLQAFRPGTASSMPVATFPSISRHLPQLLPSQPLLSSPPAVPSTSQNRPQHQGELTALWNPSLSALELLMDVGHRPHIPGNRISSRFPQISSTFGSLGQSYLDTLGNVQGNQTSSAVATNAVCLSDDD